MVSSNRNVAAALRLGGIAVTTLAACTAVPVLAAPGGGIAGLPGGDKNVNVDDSANSPFIQGSLETNMTWAGSVTSQGDGVMNAPLARSTFGVTGSGIKVGVISDSYNFLGGAAGGVASGDLPGPGNPLNSTPVDVVKDDLVAGRIDEGRAMIELIHDVAPGAQIYFHSAFNNTSGPAPDQSIADAIDALVAQGVDIIVDDVFNLRTSAYQDGPAARSVNNAFANGIAYFSSAGNNSNRAYEHTFVDSGTVQNVGGTNFRAHSFTGDTGSDFSITADGTLDLLLNPGQSARVTLHWDDPYASASAPGATIDTDLDLVVYSGSTALTSLSSFADQSNGADPVEFVSFINNGASAATVGLAPLLFSTTLTPGTSPLLKMMIYGGTILDTGFAGSNAPTVFGQTAADGAISTAAMSVFDAGLNDVESFSALGGVTILFDEDGNPIVEFRNKPDLTGPDGANTTFFGSDSGSDADAFPNFFGTSAAAPHAAAVAALLLQRAADLGITLSVADLYNLLFTTAIDIETPGYDLLSGHGRIDAFVALSAVPEPTTAAALLALAAAAPLRRRRNVTAA